MIEYISTPYTVIPPLEDYSVIVEIIPVKEHIQPDSWFWEYREEFNTAKKKLGEFTIVKNSEGKWLVGLHAAFRNAAPSTIRYNEDKGWISDSEQERNKAFAESIIKLGAMIKDSLGGEARVVSLVLLSKEYKQVLKKHMSNVEYFVKYVEGLIDPSINWTVFHQEAKRIKSNKLKTKIINDDNVTYGI